MTNKDTELKPYVEFAGQIVNLALEADHDTETLMTGLAVATAASLVDLSMEDERTIDHLELKSYVEQFIKTLHAAVNFATEQVESENLISEKNS